MLIFRLLSASTYTTKEETCKKSLSVRNIGCSSSLQSYHNKAILEKQLRWDKRLTGVSELIRLFTVPYFVFTRRSGSSTYRYGQPSWVHMHRGGWCQFDTHPPTRSGTFETKMVNHSAKCNILTILWKEETDKNLHQPTNNLESSHFHIILAKLERCTCRRCLRAWGVKEQKDKERRKGQKKKMGFIFFPIPHPAFHLPCSFTPLFFGPASLAQLKRTEKMAMEASPQTN